MSQYIHFFIRNNDNFLPIGSFSRNSSIYSIANEGVNAPYEKIAALTSEGILTCLRNARSDYDLVKKRIEKANRDKELVSSFNNSVEDKLEAIDAINERIEDDEYELGIIETTIGFFNTLSIIYDDVKYDSHIDEKNYLYCGIECYRPTVEDIV